jgi:ribosomal protein L24
MMRKTLFLLTLFVLFGSAFSSVHAQNADAGLKPSVVAGEVVSASSDKIVLQTKDGSIDVVLSGKTEYKRVAPENPSLKAAVASSFTDIGVGDKLLVTGILSADKKSVPAKAVYLMTKSDITQRQAKEQEQWRTRGMSGKVTLVNPQSKQLTVSTRALTGEKIVLVTVKDNADFRRYAPDSVQFSQAKQSNIDEIKPGDMIRALGDKSEDGSTFAAERVVTGSFQTVGGTVKAIDPAKNEIIVTDIQTKKDVTIVVGDNSVLKQFPADMAQRMAQMQAMQAGGIQPGGQGRTRPAQGASPQSGQPSAEGQIQRTGQGGGMGMRGGGGSIDDMLERFPNITIADLKVGDMIATSSTKGANTERVTAIKLLSGVEPFLKAAQSTGGRQGGGQRGQDSGFTIPGLDGIGLP